MQKEHLEELGKLARKLAELADQLFRLYENIYEVEEEPPFEDDGPEDDGRSTRGRVTGNKTTGSVSCKWCGKGGLHFEQNNQERWVLCYPDGTRHGCNKYKNLDGRPLNPEEARF